MRQLHARLFTILLGAAAACGVQAGEIEKLALISTIGDTMSVVFYQPSVGSHLDQNRRQVFNLPDATFDETAIKATTDAVSRLSVATPIPVVAPALDAASRQSTSSTGRLVPSIGMQTILRNSGATHLLLFTKHRSNTMLKIANGTIGTGYLEGLGFYVDRSKRMSRSDNGRSGTGFLAPFAYFQVSLVDLSSWEILKEEIVQASTTLSAARLDEGFDPWDILNADQKVAILQKFIRTETTRVVPLLLNAK